MKFFEPKTFRSATSPLILIRWILGIGTIEYPIGRPRRAISVCWSSTLFSGFLYSATITVRGNLWDGNNTLFSTTSYLIFNITATIAGIAFIYFGQARSKNVMDSFSKLDRVNEMLNKLGIPKEYGLTLKSQIIFLIGTLLYMSSMLAFTIMYMYKNAPTLLIACAISRQYMTLISFLEAYTFSSYVRYIGNRFRHLNKYIAELSTEDGNVMSCLQDLNDEIPCVENLAQPRHVIIADQQCMMCILRNIKKIHHDLCDIARNLNGAFGVQIVSSMTIAISVITGVLFNMYALFLKSTAISTIDVGLKILANAPWIGFHTMEFSGFIFACSMASDEAQQTKEEIHKLVKSTTCNEVREEIHTLSLRIMQDPLQFTASGLFTLDQSVIRAIVGTITTYLVIIIQMGKTPVQVSNGATNDTIPAMNTTV